MKVPKTGVVLSIIFVLVACTRDEETDWLSKDFEEIEKAAKTTEVAFYMFGGWAHVNAWIDTFVAVELKRLYDIQLKRIPMDASIFVNKLLTEKQARKNTGTMDILWINGENFKNAREANLLYGPYANILPNHRKYVDEETVKLDFGYPVEGYESAYGRAQFVFEYDSEKIKNPPNTYSELLQWVKEHPGKFTYPQPPDFTGSAFIRQVLYAVTGGHQQYLDSFDRELLVRNTPTLWEYLNEMKPYLWQKGRAYPRDSENLDTLFERGEIDLNMSYHQAHAQNMIVNKRYEPSVRTFVMQEGSIYNTHFTAIPFNAPNKPGALVTANFLLSIEAQYSKNDPKNWGDFTALEMTKLPEIERVRFESLELGEATLSFDVLVNHAVPEIPAEYLEALESGWEEHVLRQAP